MRHKFVILYYYKLDWKSIVLDASCSHLLIFEFLNVLSSFFSVLFRKNRRDNILFKSGFINSVKKCDGLCKLESI